MVNMMGLGDKEELVLCNDELLITKFPKQLLPTSFGWR